LPVFLKPTSVFSNARIEKLLSYAGSTGFSGFGLSFNSDIFVIWNNKAHKTILPGASIVLAAA
jgi:hypothetical protein